MYRVFRIVPVWALLLLPACSTIIDGDSETLTFNSAPSGADCKLNRKTEVVGEVITPGQVTGPAVVPAAATSTTSGPTAQQN